MRIGSDVMPVLWNNTLNENIEKSQGDLFGSGNIISPYLKRFIMKILKKVFLEKKLDLEETYRAKIFYKIHNLKSIFFRSEEDDNMEELREGAFLEGRYGRYEIVKLIKSGGMGAVYKAIDLRTETFCAIKELLPFYISLEEKFEARRWFRREAELLSRFSHEGIPGLSDYFISKNRYYLVMDFIEGENLKKLLLDYGIPGLPEENVIEWSKKVLEILHYLHNQNPRVIYRDMKPANIMITPEGSIKLIDFGIARIFHRKNQKMTKIGTEGYSPVEQYKGRPETRSDIYAMGATIHHLLTGIEPLPFKFQSLRNINPSVSPELECIVMKALEDNPDDRFSSASEMLASLNCISKK